MQLGRCRSSFHVIRSVPIKFSNVEIFVMSTLRIDLSGKNLPFSMLPHHKFMRGLMAIVGSCKRTLVYFLRFVGPGFIVAVGYLGEIHLPNDYFVYRSVSSLMLSLHFSRSWQLGIGRTSWIAIRLPVTFHYTTVQYNGHISSVPSRPLGHRFWT